MRFTFKGETYRIIFHHDPAPPRCSCGRISNKKRKRSTTCKIQHWATVTKLGGTAQYWEDALIGHSRLNVKEGDVFTKRGGREASLANALGADFNGVEDGSFADYAWACYDRHSPVSFLDRKLNVQFGILPYVSYDLVNDDVQVTPNYPWVIER